MGLLFIIDNVFLDNLIAKAKIAGPDSGESAYIEFKLNVSETYGRVHASLGYEQVGQYISALANAACVYDQHYAYLVLGVTNGDWDIVGTNFSWENARFKNQNFQLWLRKQFAPNCPFEVHELSYHDKHVVVFKIKAATGFPLSYNGVKYTRISSSNVLLSNFPEQERKIFNSNVDWSAEIVSDASIDDLDPRAIAKARQLFADKNKNLADEMLNWNDETFLNRARICIRGQITRTAIILLGKPESAALISPFVVTLRWTLRNSTGDARDYLLKSTPFISSVDEIFQRIRNLKYRYINKRALTLYPEEIDTYDVYVIREAIHNAIAHQDYNEKAYINIVEYDDRLVFENRGRFIPGSVHEVLTNDAPESHYRNPFLIDAMRELKMVDTVGNGIQKMFRLQRERLFPLPDYVIDEDKKSVSLTIMGKAFDEEYTNLLIDSSDLSLGDMELLNRVFMNKPISDNELKYLRAKKLIEGRKPNIYIAKSLAQSTGKEIDYTNNKGLNEKFYKEFIIEALKQHGELQRSQFNDLLLPKLPSSLSEKQKINKVGNLLSKLKRDGHIIYGEKKLWRLKN